MARPPRPGPELRVYVPAELHAELKRRAASNDRPISGEAVRAIRAYLADYARAQELNEEGTTTA